MHFRFTKVWWKMLPRYEIVRVTQKYYLFKYYLDKGTTHPKFDLTGVRTHDRQIMDSTFNVREMLVLTTEQSETSLTCCMFSWVSKQGLQMIWCVWLSTFDKVHIHVTAWLLYMSVIACSREMFPLDQQVWHLAPRWSWVLQRRASWATQHQQSLISVIVKVWAYYQGTVSILTPRTRLEASRNA